MYYINSARWRDSKISKIRSFCHQLNQIFPKTVKIAIVWPIMSLYATNSYNSIIMPDKKPESPSLDYILKKISDDKSLTLFNSIAVSEGNKYTPLKEMNLTTKQYYSRISGLLNAGLIKRHKGKYSLTLLGKIVYDSQLMIGKTLAYYWKLKALESIEMSSGTILPAQEMAQLVNTLIDNHQIKDILMKQISVSSLEKDSKVFKSMPIIEEVRRI
jgi:hypothetical protein